jgi:hypothetical protein
MRLAGAFLVLTAGFVGEASAVYTFYQGRDDTLTRLTVLIATIILLFAVINGPTLAYVSILLVMRHPRPAPPPARNPPSPAPARPKPDPADRLCPECLNR